MITMSDKSEQHHDTDGDEKYFSPHRRAVHVAIVNDGIEGEVDSREIKRFCKCADLEYHPHICDFCTEDDKELIQTMIKRFGIGDDYDPDAEAGEIPEDVLRDMRIEGIA